jgi:hypothetical protein
MWSRVGLIAAAGFAVGVLWPRLAGVDIGPRAPEDARIEAAAAAAGPLPSASASAAAATSAGPAAPPAPAPAEPPKNKQIVVVGPGAIQRCWDDKDKKVEDCGELQLDPVAKKRLESLATCSAALGLEGKVNVVFDLDFKKKEVHVARAKKNSLPSSTVDGIVQCAAKELMKLDLGEVPHAFRRYTVSYALTFYPPGKEPQEAEVVADATPDAGGRGRHHQRDRGERRGDGLLGHRPPAQAAEGRRRGLAHRPRHPRQDRSEAERLVPGGVGRQDRLGLPRRHRVVATPPHR